MNTDTAELAYLAGFFDGEGCVRVARNVRVIVAGCFRPGLLERFSGRWGGNINRHTNSRPGQRQGVRWEVTGSKAAACLRDLLPLLFEKAEQARIALEYHAYKQHQGVRGGKGYSAAQQLHAASLEARLKALKRVQHVY